MTNPEVLEEMYPQLKRKSKFPLWLALLIIALVFGVFSLVKANPPATFKLTAYCACQRCCGKTDAITASGYKAQYGFVACNWLPFGTKVKIEGLGTFIVMDRGAKSLFGSKNNHIKHLDIYMPTHREARNFGVKYAEVEVL